NEVTLEIAHDVMSQEPMGSRQGTAARPGRATSMSRGSLTVWLPSRLSDSSQLLRLHAGEWHQTEPAAHGPDQFGIADQRDPVARLGGPKQSFVSLPLGAGAT